MRYLAPWPRFLVLLVVSSILLSGCALTNRMFRDRAAEEHAGEQAEEDGQRDDRERHPEQGEGEAHRRPQAVERAPPHPRPEAVAPVQLRAAPDRGEGGGHRADAGADHEVDLHPALVERAQDTGVVRASRAAAREQERGAPLRRVVPHEAPTLPPAGAARRAGSAARTAALTSADSAAGELRTSVEDYPELVYAGYTQDAFKEYCEAILTLALVRGDAELPTPAALKP